MARRVDLTDQTPLIIDEGKLVNGKCAVCRCGLSGAWPMCDGTHKATIGEEPGKLYRYERELPQGTIKRHEVGDIEMPGTKVQEPPAPEGAPSHGGARPSRGQRPAVREAEGTRGNEAGREGREGAGDELLEGGALATGGAERAALAKPGTGSMQGKARNEVRVTGSSADEPSRAI